VGPVGQRRKARVRGDAGRPGREGARGRWAARAEGGGRACGSLVRMEREGWAVREGRVWFPGPGFLPFLSGLRWVWVRVRFSIYSIFIYSLFPNLIQTKFEFKYKFEFKPHSNN